MPPPWSSRHPGSADKEDTSQRLRKVETLAVTVRPNRGRYQLLTPSSLDSLSAALRRPGSARHWLQYRAAPAAGLRRRVPSPVSACLRVCVSACLVWVCSFVGPHTLIGWLGCPLPAMQLHPAVLSPVLGGAACRSSAAFDSLAEEHPIHQHPPSNQTPIS